MKPNLTQLSKEQRAILAHLRASLALQLAAETFRNDKALQEMCPPSGIALGFIIPGDGAFKRAKANAYTGAATVKMQLVVKNGSARICSAGRPQLVLFFPRPESAIRILSGGKGLAIPLPLRPGAFKALSFFKKASSRATELLRKHETPEDIQARLLLVATLYGLEAVARDSYLARRMEIIPEGTVAVRAGEIQYFVEKRKHSINVIETQQRSDAVLSFTDYQSAVAVLSGKRPAVVALGAGEVRIEGLLPLVQGLFAVLDRLSWYLGVAL